jgi:hypothetical protein
LDCNAAVLTVLEKFFDFFALFAIKHLQKLSFFVIIIESGFADTDFDSFAK